MQVLFLNTIITLVKKQLLISIFAILFLIAGTTLAILYGKGYIAFDKGRPDFSGTGLLVATSNPNGAQVFIDGHLTTATDNTINLQPGEYTVKIFKEGYFPWQKKIKIQKEVVSKAEALLFPTAPKLESITASGVENPAIDPSQTRIAYTVSSQTLKKNGVYMLDMSTRPILTLQSASTQIADNTENTFSDAFLSWSPDGNQIIATISAEPETVTTYLLSASEFNDSPRDVTATIQTLKETWQKEQMEKEKSRLDALKPKLRQIISENFNVIAWSPDETKILYSASTSASIPIIISPRLIGTNSTPEEREIKKDTVYVYDIKEDRNYKILESDNSQLPLSWLSDSKHLIYVHDKKIDIMEYDSLNLTTIYAGPFIDNYVFPWPNGSKLVILTNLNNPNIPPNLYTISLK